MSTHITSLVMERSTATGAAYSVIRALGDFADSGGYSWYSERKIAEAARCTDRTVRSALNSLEAAGEIAVLRARGRGRHNLYRVLIGQPAGAGDREVLEAYIIERLIGFAHLLPQVQGAEKTGNPLQPPERPEAKTGNPRSSGGQENRKSTAVPPAPPYMENLQVQMLQNNRRLRKLRLLAMPRPSSSRSSLDPAGPGPSPRNTQRPARSAITSPT